MRAQLTDLLRQLAQLQLALVPAAGPADGPRVTTSRTGSAASARLDALSILGPGSDAVYARHLPDQIGETPPTVWLDSWERAWRKVFRAYSGDHHNPARGHVPAMDIVAPGPVRLDRPAVRTLLGVAGGPAALAAMFTVGAAWTAHRREAARVQIGMRDGHAGRQPERRGVDPLVDEWLLRFGPAAAVPTTQVNFLTRWLDRACEHDDIPIADFAAELRAVSYELGYALGEIDEKTWLGRCPTAEVDTATGEIRYCGAGLWQDPYTGATYDGGGRPDGIRVQCPRCRTAWGPNRLDLVVLAGSIRKAWPVDRRRRYRTADRALQCRCGGRLDIEWRDVTATDDRVRWWQPVAASCPSCATEAL
jgi:hypothetical protein